MLLVIKCMGYGGPNVSSSISWQPEIETPSTTNSRMCWRRRTPWCPRFSQRRKGAQSGRPYNGDLLWTLRLRRLLVEGHFDIVHFHLPYAAALGRLVARSLPRGQRPVLMYTEHSLWHKTVTPVRILNRATIGLDKALVAVSPAAHDALPASLQAHATVVIHGVDLTKSDALISREDEIRAEVRCELGVAAEEILVLAVANLRVEKGYDVLLDTARILADQGLPIRIATVGRGPLRTN